MTAIAIREEVFMRVFGIPQEELAECLKATGAVVAGSAALAMAMSGFEPGDIDIWVHSPSIADSFDFSDPAQSVFHPFLARYAYALERSRRTLQYEELGVLKHIETFRHASTGRSVQVIFVSCSVKEAVFSFDISVCATWWDGLGLFALDPQGIVDRTFTNSNPKNPILAARSNKYQSRGFRPAVTASA
eukprot:GILI01029519.1.p1 GENE.GILI01029519.1~~GILI01029519.1.p1  ORF type:complete len:189 (-),score=52.52 GILI01029519.1:420-986(-)